jgi:hypothetical protein
MTGGGQADATPDASTDAQADGRPDAAVARDRPNPPTAP